MQGSGGALLAADLDGGNTFIFISYGNENANESALPCATVRKAALSDMARPQASESSFSFPPILSKRFIKS